MLSSTPLVSLICICHNHARYVDLAIQSVQAQTYPNIELIIVDDASDDHSLSVIEKSLANYPKPFETLFNEENLGHCKSFNKAFKLAKGEFVIDMAADDVLEVNRIEEGVNVFLERGEDYGVHYSNAEIIDAGGSRITVHDTGALAGQNFPLEGFLFEQILAKYFICPPSMMYRSSLIDELAGYDETLFYEDFDFWVRSSRITKYCFSELILVKKRVLKSSKSSGQYRLGSKMIASTYMVCQKAFNLCRNEAEYKALQVRINYESKMALASLNFRVAFMYFRLKQRIVKQVKELKPQR